MAKAAFNKSYKINAKGVLSIDEGIVSVENPDTGELVELATLFIDFADKPVSISISYDEDYESE
jgi:hypothetical protein|nr:MAG TPA: YonK protein [Caudoviricetes sp.]DAT63943.1 MAG TPA: YonK protein [Caudoviricetes sp.]